MTTPADTAAEIREITQSVSTVRLTECLRSLAQETINATWDSDNQGVQAACLVQQLARAIEGSNAVHTDILLITQQLIALRDD